MKNSSSPSESWQTQVFRLESEIKALWWLLDSLEDRAEKVEDQIKANTLCLQVLRAQKKPPE